MTQKPLLSVTTVVTDFSFVISKSSKYKEIVGKSLLDLFVADKENLGIRLQKMKQGSIYQTETLLNLDGTPKRYSVSIRRGHFRFIIVFIELEHIYQLMENVALYRQYAFIDELTGALTRHGYWNELYELLRYTEKLGYNIGIIFADIDNLKRINTDSGYKGGDLQISEMSQTIQKALRKNDILVRLGGDEFLALLPMRGNGSNIVNVIAKRIVKLVHANPLLETTLSLGTKVVTATEISEILSKKDVKKAWEKHLVIADRNVKKAKQSGKNQVVS